MSELSFFVAGIPQTQGGMKPIPNKNSKSGFVLISTGSKDLAPWRRAVTNTAKLAVNLNGWPQGTTAPVQLVLRFFLAMPKNRPTYVRRNQIGWHHVAQYDWDKLSRAICDGLTDAKVYKDDGQVCRTAVSKWEVADHRLCGVEIIVNELEAGSVTEPMAEALARRQSMPRAIRPYSR